MRHESQANLVTDPACGMAFSPASAAATLECQGQTVHFCSSHCASTFRREPEKYRIVLHAAGGMSKHCDRSG